MQPEQGRVNSLQELGLLLPFIQLRRWELLLILLLGLVTSCLDGLGISLVVLFLYGAIGNLADVSQSEGLIGDIFQTAVGFLGARPVLIGAVVFVIIGASSTLRYLYAIMAETIGQRISENIRIGLHDQFLDVSYDYIRRQDPSFLLDVIEDESWAISEVITHLLTIATNVFSIVVFAALLVATSWQFTLIATVGSLLLIGCIRLLRAPAERLGAVAIDVNNALTKRTLTTVSCLRTIRAFGAESSQKIKFQTDARRVRDTFVKLRRVSELVNPIAEIGHIALLCLFVGAASVLGISFAGSLASVALLHRLRPQIQSLQERWIELASASAALRNIRVILDRSDRVCQGDPGRVFDRLGSAIRFEHVTLRYPGSSRDALHKVSFAVPAGGVTALVGPSGAGKSTIVNLLLRLYEPDSGVVLVDGVPLSRIDRLSWLRGIALAGQDIELTEGTVAENIAMSRPEARPDELRAAAELSSSLEFIQQQPLDLDSLIGERGLSLSHGQRQRLGLARAFLRDPDLLILDEAMSALDVALETRIRANIEKRFKRRTVLFITHRLESVLDADHIVCIGEGCILEEGPPSELLSRPHGVLRGFLQSDKSALSSPRLRAHERRS